jgi:hypothetical protein
MNCMFDAQAAKETGRLFEYLSWFKAVGVEEQAIWTCIRVDIHGPLGEYTTGGKGPYTLHKRLFKPFVVDIPLENWL